MLPAKTPTESSGYRALFQNRPFVLLWSGQVLSQIADKVLLVMLIALLDSYNIPARFTASSSSYLMVASTIPAIIFGAAGGIFVDRYPKKQIMVLADVIRACLILLIPLLPKEFAILLLITFAVSTVTQIFAPAEQAAIPLVVKRENLLTANALFTTTQMGSLIVGFAIGEPILTAVTNWLGAGAKELFVATLYLLAAGLGQLVRIKENIVISDAELKINPWRDFKTGLDYLRSRKILLNAMTQLAILFSAIAALPVLSIALTTEIGLPAKQFGFLVAAAGIGLVLGAGMLGHWGHRFHHKPLPLVGFISMGIVLAIFTWVDRIWVGLLLSGILGFGASLIAVPMQTLMQEKTPESMRGKVFGFQNNAVNIALSLPLVITGPLTDTFGLRPVLLGMSAIVIVAGVWAWQSTKNVLEDVI
jgi:MFS family permease